MYNVGITLGEQLMEKMKIGKFIATCRKDKNITQEQLAEMIGITNKSVSKWENGFCLPEACSRAYDFYIRLFEKIL